MIAFRDIDFHGFIEGLIRIIELRDVYTAGHSKRVSEIAEMIGRELGMTDKDCEYIHVAGHLHDIGKIGIPDGILLKTGKLSDAEYSVMRQHPIIGAAIFENQEGFESMARIIKHHHERYDGLGYPDGLRGEEIPEGAAIIAVADSFDAMTTSRTYRSGMLPYEAIAEISEYSGRQFHPDVADAFKRIFERDKNKIDLIIRSHNSNGTNILYEPFNSMRTEYHSHEERYVSMDVNYFDQKVR